MWLARLAIASVEEYFYVDHGQLGCGGILGSFLEPISNLLAWKLPPLDAIKVNFDCHGLQLPVLVWALRLGTRADSF